MTTFVNRINDLAQWQDDCARANLEYAWMCWQVLASRPANFFVSRVQRPLPMLLTRYFWHSQTCSYNQSASSLISHQECHFKSCYKAYSVALGWCVVRRALHSTINQLSWIKVSNARSQVVTAVEIAQMHFPSGTFVCREQADAERETHLLAIIELARFMRRIIGLPTTNWPLWHPHGLTAVKDCISYFSLILYTTSLPFETLERTFSDPFLSNLFFNNS